MQGSVGTRERWQEWVDEAAAAYREVAAAGRDIELGNVVESTVFDVLGRASSVGSFLVHCFHS